MTKNLNEILEFCENLKQEYENPPLYLNDEGYYRVYAAKVDVLDEVINEIRHRAGITQS